jgi:hypothetical protein
MRDVGLRAFPSTRIMHFEFDRKAKGIAMKKETRLFVAAVAAMSLCIVAPKDRSVHAAVAAPNASSNGNCSRECLKGFIDQYLEAMTRHDPSKLAFAASAKVTENGGALKPGEGFWKTAGPTTYRLYALDPQAGQAAVEAVVQEDNKPTCVLLRLKIENRQISEVETIVTRKGQGAPFGPERLTATSPIYEEPVPPPERSTRNVLIAAADGYFTAVQTEGTKDYRPAPFAPDAVRFENGVQTTSVSTFGDKPWTAAQQLDLALFKGAQTDERRFPVVDVKYGIVLGMAVFRAPAPTPGAKTVSHTGFAERTGPRALYVAEMFKVTGGKIHQIQAITLNRPYDTHSGWN